MITASEAKRKTVEYREVLQKKELEFVEIQINNAIKDGMDAVELTQYELWETTINELEKLGYKIRKPTGDHIEVSWK